VEEMLQENQTFTTAVWTAIRLSKNAEWVLATDSVPQTPAWKDWLSIAGEKARLEEDDWDAQKALGELLGRHAKVLP
jgi:hypothetical protein